MPLRDHFRPPLDDVHSWDELHGMWPAMIVRELQKVLPEPYFAAPGVHLGTLYEVDIGTYRPRVAEENNFDPAMAGGAAVATYSPPKPTLTLQPQLPDQDSYEVRIYDSRRNRQLIAAIEIISPSNKDRSETRGTFIAKVATLLRNGLLAVWPEIEFNKQADAIDAKTADDPAAQRELRTFMSSAAKLKFDSQRRATIPEFLRKRWTIGPGTAVTYVGVRDRVEVWATDAWRAYLQAEAPVA